MNLRDAHQIRDAVNAGEISAREWAEAALKRIESIDSVDSGLGVFLTVEPETVLQRAAAVDEAVKHNRLPLAGVPVAVKDNICTRHLRTTCGSRILENYRPPYSATAIERLEAAGAVVIGKVNCDEFAMGSSTENSAFKVTRNPYDPERVPGGSSGGSAVAVAAAMAPLALGSETGGSVRQPASFCNVLGLKPTYGRVSRYGLVAFASSLDCIAPLANSPRDLALVLSVIAGRDEHDATSAPFAVPDYLSELRESVRGMRLGVPREFFSEGLDPEIKRIIEAGIRNAEALGCSIEEVSLPHTKYAVADYYVIAPAEASSNLARYDGVKYGYRAPDSGDLLEMYKQTRSRGFGAEVKRRIMIGTYALSAGYYDAYYGRAQRVRTMVRRDFEAAFQKVDLIASPTSPTVAFEAGSRTADPLAMYVSDVCTIPANLAGLPAISIPCGLSDSLPVGFQLIGPAFSENRMLQAAHALEGAIGFDTAPTFRDSTPRPEAEGWQPGEVRYRPEDAQS
jgi:aspartyl-tRNA(Asn)/glutamyl-tRNA(Gln) amidotransferase subunit A